MEIILTQPIRNLGDIDDVVTVKNGYARNYLIPQKMAILATPSNLRSVEEKKKQASHKQEHLKAQAQEIADKLSDLTISIETLAGADGKLFGSVTSLMVAKELEEKGFPVDRRKITLDDIRSTGEYVATVHGNKEATADLSLEVKAAEND
ncbi:MAG: 50S ribosomal protein L9 [Bacteroidia bacterium]